MIKRFGDAYEDLALEGEWISLGFDLGDGMTLSVILINHCSERRKLNNFHAGFVEIRLIKSCLLYGFLLQQSIVALHAIGLDS